jgi:hypothetical protein
MRAMLCGCRRHLDATDEEELFGKVVELPADTTEAVEGYGPEPY